MYEITEKYVDYNGVEREETFYFNLTAAELMKMEFKTAGGFTERIKKIIASKDTVEIMRTFEEFLNMSYGRKSDDGKRFIKSEEMTREFMETPAYSQIYMKLASDEKSATEFINHVVPADLNAQIAKAESNKVIPMSNNK